MSAFMLKARNKKITAKQTIFIIDIFKKNSGIPCMDQKWAKFLGRMGGLINSA